MKRAHFVGHHVLIEIGRTPHRLAGVINDEIQSGAGVDEVPAKGLDAGCMPKIQAEDLEAMAPLFEVRLASVTGCGVTRKACRHNEVSPGTKQPDASLITDLHASAREQGNASTQISRFGAFAIIQVCAFGAKLVVEMMQLR